MKTNMLTKIIFVGSLIVGSLSYAVNSGDDRGLAAGNGNNGAKAPGDVSHAGAAASTNPDQCECKVAPIDRHATDDLDGKKAGVHSAQKPAAKDNDATK